MFTVVVVIEFPYAIENPFQSPTENDTVTMHLIWLAMLWHHFFNIIATQISFIVSKGCTKWVWATLQYVDRKPGGFEGGPV